MGIETGFLSKVSPRVGNHLPGRLTNSPDLRARFVRTELALFKHRFETDDVSERAAFLRSLEFDWQVVDESEKVKYAKELKACLWGDKEEGFRTESWFKVCFSGLYQSPNKSRVMLKAGSVVYCS